jgi:multicomponent Na+:H+ antiporter subunit D
LFLVSGLFLRQRRTTDLTALGGLYATQPAVAVMAMIPVFSLAGIPPLSGFVAKLAVVAGALDAQQYVVTAVALAVGLATVLSMARVWDEGFWKPAPNPGTPPRLGPAIVSPIVALAVLTLGVTVLAGPLSALSRRAAEQLLHPDQYIQAVLGSHAHADR